MKFTIHKRSNKSRKGKIELPHGSFETPAFMTVGTYGSVKSLSNKDLYDCNVDIILCNAYHLMLSPDNKTLEKKEIFDLNIFSHAIVFNGLCIPHFNILFLNEIFISLKKLVW